MTRYPDPDTLRSNARALRTEALSGMAREGAIKWRSLVSFLGRRQPSSPTSHAPFPCQGPSPSHP